MKAHRVFCSSPRISSSDTVEKTSGVTLSVMAASSSVTTWRACSTVVMNGIFRRVKVTDGNCWSIMLPSVSAEMPVPPARKKAGVGRGEDAGVVDEATR